MRRATVVGCFFALLSTACDKGGGEENDIAEDESGIADEESGGTETGAAERCEEQLSQSACDNLIATDEAWQCEWVDVWSSPGSCEAGTSQARCVTFNSPGAGCGGSFACNDQGDARTFVRDAGEAGVEVIQAEICGLDPEWGVWEQCQWDAMGNVSPHAACGCGC